jgi:hypothetical protein
VGHRGKLRPTLHRYRRKVGREAEDDGGRILGNVQLVFVRYSCYVEDVLVTPEARGTATVWELLKAAFPEADRCGAERTFVETQEFDPSARSVYYQVARRTSSLAYERQAEGGTGRAPPPPSAPIWRGVSGQLRAGLDP